MNAKALGSARSAAQMAISIAVWAVLAVATALLAVFAAMAAAVIGVVVLGAALALRFAPQPRPAGGPDAFEARRTPEGWVVEIGAARRR